MPIVDMDVGITEYLGSHKPFQALLKQTPDDFLVSEILLDGTIAKITKLAQSNERNKKRDRSQLEKPVEATYPELSISEDVYEQLDTFFDPEERPKASGIVSVSLSQQKISIKLPPCKDKQNRTKVHGWVRNNMPGFFSSTMQTEQGSVIKVTTKDPRFHWKRRRLESGRDSSSRDDKSESKTDAKIEAVVEGETNTEKQRESHEVTPNKEVSKPMNTSMTDWKDVKSKEAPLVEAMKTDNSQNGNRAVETKVEEQLIDESVSVQVKRGTSSGSNVPMNPGNEGGTTKVAGEGSASQRVDRFTFVQFLLWKRNRDTYHVFSQLAKELRLKPSVFLHAGTKDKRGVTTQLVQVRGIHEKRLARAVHSITKWDRHGRSVAIGNFSVVPRNGKRFNLGSLLGNHFEVVLRNIDCQGETAESNFKAAVSCIQNIGFINYFGLQRFGTGVSPTHETGFAFFRGDFEDVCRRLLLPLRVEDDKRGVSAEREGFYTALQQFAKKEITAETLLSSIPRRMTIERTLALSFADDEKRGVTKHDYRKAFSQLHRNSRKIYGHAVQSYLFNVMASERIRLHRPDGKNGMHAIEGDLVVESDQGDSFNYETEVQSVTKEEEEKKSISVYRVVIPIIGSKVPVPDAPYAKKCKEILEEKKVDVNTKLSSEYGMLGTYRRLVVRPKGFTATLKTYTDCNEPLVDSGVDHLIEQINGNSGDVKDTKTPNAGAKSTAAVAPGEQVHNDKIENGEDVKSEKEKPQQDGDIKNESRNGRRAGPPVDPLKGKERQAAILSFSLGCAEYATMLFRELTHQDSSKSNQKAIMKNLEG